MQSIFSDSVSAIGKSVLGKSVRYWKQVKPSRSSEWIYNETNVIGMNLLKKDDMFLTFEWFRFGEEREHLHKPNQAEIEKEEKRMAARDLRAEGKSVREIADQLGVSKSQVGRWTKEG